jgi:hypothetical protein
MPACRVLPLAGLLLVGCLPEAGAPVGRQLIAQRGIAELSIADGAAAHVLFTRITAMSLSPGARAFDDTPNRDLFIVPRAGGAERVLRRDLPTWTTSSSWDARGRLYLTTGSVERGPGVNPGGLGPLTRFDPGAAGEQDLGLVSQVLVSEGGALVFYQPEEGGGSVRDLDDRERALGRRADGARFLGQDLYFVAGSDLYVLGETDATPTLLTGGVNDWAPLDEAKVGELVLRTDLFSEPRLIQLVRPAPRPARVVRVVAAGALAASVSSDGTRVGVIERTGQRARVRLRVVRAADGDTRTVELDVPPPSADGLPPGLSVGPPSPSRGSDPFVQLVFRPGSDEVWCFLERALRIVDADGSVRAVEGRHPGVDSLSATANAQFRSGGPIEVASPRDGPPLFTSDGRRWIFTDDDGNPSLFVGDPDDPNGSALRLGRRSQVQRVAEGAPGQLYVWLRPGENARVDLMAVEPAPARLALREVVRDIRGAVLGPKSVVALVRGLGQDALAPGDLVVVDLASGAERLLGRNVTEFALAGVCPTCDPAAPGLPLAFVVNARIPFRYDGLWTSELP